MRSNLITVVTAVASIVLTAGVATADQVQEQLRLMEQRMAEMEDRLQATSDELRTARSTVAEQQDLLTDAGLLEEEGGIRSSVGKFFEQVDVNGVMAASYNHRILDGGDDNLSNSGLLFRHPNANTFALDQAFVSLNKTPTEEDRAGFNVEFAAGVSADQQISNIGENEVGIFTANVQYLANVGNGLLITAGKQGTLIGAEVLQTNQNMNITQGLVWGMQPVTYTGVLAETSLGDGLSVAFGIFNDIYDQTSADDSVHKSYFGSVAYETDAFGIRVSNIIGRTNDVGSSVVNNDGGICDLDEDECKTNVFNTVVTAQPADNIAVWADFTWVRNMGRENESKGDSYGVAVAGEVGVTDRIDVASRFEYVRMESGYRGGLSGSGSDLMEQMSITGTVSKALTDCLALRTELRYDKILSDKRDTIANGNQAGDTNSRKGQLVALAEVYYEF